MRKVFKYLVGISALLGLGAFSYHAASPKVALTNLSGDSFKELLVTLPSSRVSFGPIAPLSSATIYFSRQASGGTATYSLHNGKIVVAEGTVQYPESGQLFRVISFTIESDGTLSVAVSG